jgi:glycosyltransferase involved in cell wall biosynthesis
MRVLHSSIGYPPPAGAPCGPVNLGGVPKVMQTICAGLAARDHDVTVWCTNRLDQRRKLSTRTVEAELDGVDVRYFNTHCLPFWPGTFGPSYTPELDAAIDRELDTVDLVHLHEFRSYMSFKLARAAQQRGIPYIVQPHGSTDLLSFYNSLGWKRVYDRLFGLDILRNACAAIALQPDEAGKLHALGAARGNIQTIPNSIDPALRCKFPAPGAFRARHGIAAERRVVLFVGRLEKRKGADVLIRAHSMMTSPRPLLVMCGPDDGILSQLRTLVRDLGTEPDVLFTGALTGEPLWAAYLDSDVFVLPSLFEIFGLVILEACLAGKPMIVSSTCQIAGLVRDRAALIADPTPDAFSQALTRLLSDHELRAELARGAHSLVESQLSVQVQIDRVEQLYGQIRHQAHETVDHHS